MSHYFPELTPTKGSGDDDGDEEADDDDNEDEDDNDQVEEVDLLIENISIKSLKSIHLDGVFEVEDGKRFILPPINDPSILDKVLRPWLADGTTNQWFQSKEFTGDALIGMSVKDVWHHIIPMAAPKVLTVLTACVVQNAQLIVICEAIGLADRAIMDPGRRKGKKWKADLVETYFGALTAWRYPESYRFWAHFVVAHLEAIFNVIKLSQPAKRQKRKKPWRTKDGNFKRLKTKNGKASMSSSQVASVANKKSPKNALKPPPTSVPMNHRKIKELPKRGPRARLEQLEPSSNKGPSPFNIKNGLKISNALPNSQRAHKTPKENLPPSTMRFEDQSRSTASQDTNAISTAPQNGYPKPIPHQGLLKSTQNPSKISNTGGLKPKHVPHGPPVAGSQTNGDATAAHGRQPTDASLPNRQPLKPLKSDSNASNVIPDKSSAGYRGGKKCWKPNGSAHKSNKSHYHPRR